MAATMSKSVINTALVTKPLKATSTRRATVTVRASQGLTTEPVVPPKKQSTLDYAKTLPGVTQPFPDVFDPANFLATASVKDVRRWRESELVHGRVSMLAALGFIVQEQLEDFPAFLNADGHVTGPAIGHFQQVEARGAVFWEPLLLAIGLAEAYRVGLGWETPTGDGFNALKDDYELGNLGFDPLGLLPSDPAEKKIMQTKELNNGRLAMIAIAAFVAQELVEKTEIFEHLFTRFGAEIAAEDATLVKELSSIP